MFDTCSISVCVEVIMLRGGESVLPLPIESRILTALPFLSHVVVVGDGKPYLSCLMTLSVRLYCVCCVGPYLFQSQIRLLRAPDRRFFQHACVILPKSTHPFHPHARALWRSFFLPFYRPTHSFCACLSAFWDIYDMCHSIRTLLLFASTERVDESNIKAPTSTSKCWLTTSEDAWVFLPDNSAILPAYRVKVHNCASFVEISRSV